MNHPLVPTLLELADTTSRNLAFAYQPGIAISFGEETITETNLLTLQHRHPAHIRIQTFSKPAEALNGSDWEWIIVGAALTLRMRLQAKRINRNGHLTGLHRKSKIAHKTQMDALIAAAKEDEVVPAYCLYSAERHRKVWQTSDPGLETGCLIAKASEVRNLSDQSFGAVEEISVPWHFLFSGDRFERRRAASPPPVGSGDWTQITPTGPFEPRVRSGPRLLAVPRRPTPFWIGDRPVASILDDPLSSPDVFEGLQRTELDSLPGIVERAIHRPRKAELQPRGVIAIDLRALGE